MKRIGIYPSLFIVCVYIYIYNVYVYIHTPTAGKVRSLVRTHARPKDTRTPPEAETSLQGCPKSLISPNNRVRTDQRVPARNHPEGNLGYSFPLLIPRGSGISLALKPSYQSFLEEEAEKEDRKRKEKDKSLQNFWDFCSFKSTVEDATRLRNDFPDEREGREIG